MRLGGSAAVIPWQSENSRGGWDMRSGKWRTVVWISIAVLTAVFCSVQVSAQINAVATFPILADFVAAVGGELVNVSSLIPFGGDPHSWEPTPQHARMVADADVVFANGLGLEIWLDRLVESAADGNVPVVVLSDGLPALPYHSDEGHGSHSGHGHSHGDYDPHMWLDVTYAMAYVKRIAEVLGQLDPENAAIYRKQAEGYLEQLVELDQWLLDAAAQIPDANRRIITYHHAFAYFSARYGFTIAAYLVLNPDREPSARDMMELTKLLASHPRRVMFTEPQVSIGKRYTEVAVKEVGGTLFTLYTGSLTESVPTYIDMMRHNGMVLLEALR